ncbi:MAG TPA: hypothetical protein VGE43_19395 [Acidimicrobiales bacterium]
MTDLLLTAERYTTITGDATTAASAVSAALEDAQGLLADALGRTQITFGEVTETLPLAPSGAAYPGVLPVAAAPDGVTYRLGAFEGCPVDGGPFPDSYPYTTTVTYTAGWTDATVPTAVEIDLAWCAWRLLNPTAPTPPGATSIANGDASMSFAAPSTGSNVDGIGWSRLTLRHRRRRL